MWSYVSFPKYLNDGLPTETTDSVPMVYFKYGKARGKI